MWAADDSNENTVKGLGRTLQNLDVTGSLAALDAWVLRSARDAPRIALRGERMSRNCDLVFSVLVLFSPRLPDSSCLVWRLEIGWSGLFISGWDYR